MIQTDTPMKGRILYAEDENAVYNCIAMTMQIQGYQVERAKTGVEAIARLKDSTDISLVIMDLGMPVMDGWQAILGIREFSNIPITIFSARIPDEVRAKYQELGCGLIRKPDIKDLAKHVDSYFTQEHSYAR